VGRFLYWQWLALFGRHFVGTFGYFCFDVEMFGDYFCFGLGLGLGGGEFCHLMRTVLKEVTF
jgi:hypothetical protein